MNSTPTLAATGRTRAEKHTKGAKPKCKLPEGSRFFTGLHTSGVIVEDVRPKATAISLFFTEFSDEIDNLFAGIPDSDIRCTHLFTGTEHRFLFSVHGAGRIELNICAEGGDHGR